MCRFKHCQHDRAEFLLTPSPRGAFYYRVRAAGFATGNHGPWTARDGLRLDVRLRRESRVSGRVLLSNDEPDDAHIDVRVGDVDVKASPSGQFDLGGLPSGPARLEILRRDIKKRWLLRRMDVTLRPGQTLDVGTIRINPTFVVRGRVTDARGRPVSGARVRVVARDFLSVQKTTSRRDGTFSATVHDASIMRFHVFKDGYGAAVASGDPEQRAEIVLRSPAAIRT